MSEPAGAGDLSLAAGRREKSFLPREDEFLSHMWRNFFQTGKNGLRRLADGDAYPWSG